MLNDKTKKLFVTLFILFLSFFSFINMSVNQSFAQINEKRNIGESIVVMDAKTKRVIYSENQDNVKYMASTTKILTALVIINNCNLNEVITITDKTVGVEGSSIYLEAGEQLTIKDLLYGLMLRSGNDCAETLAIHCSKSISKFAELMNKTAKELGAYNSNFVNPHGLHNDNHYTTAYDLALISSHAINNPIFKEIVSTKWVEIPFTTRNYNRKLKNKNKLLWDLDGTTGIKTGYTKKAGRCLVSSCEKDGLEFVCVALNCPQMFEKSKTLLTDAHNSYKNVKLVDKNNFIGFSKSEQNNQLIGLYIKNDIILGLSEEELKNIQIEYDYPKTINKSVEKDTEIGKIKILCSNNLIFTEKIYTII